MNAMVSPVTVMAVAAVTVAVRAGENIITNREPELLPQLFAGGAYVVALGVIAEVDPDLGFTLAVVILVMLILATSKSFIAILDAFADIAS